MRSVIASIGVVLVVSLAGGSPCSAQGFGLGGRMSLVRGDVDADTSAERFIGGLMRVGLSPRSAVEISIDRRTDSNELLTERVVATPLQGSLLLYLVRTTLSPYVLGGVGWYTQRVEQLTAGTVTASETSRRFGYHAGIGGELKLGRHAGVHADYRYTFLKFGGDDDDDSLVGRFKPSHEGSMWTAGLTLYF
jgi:opacity protein-like surface antigen